MIGGTTGGKATQTHTHTNMNTLLVSNHIVRHIGFGIESLTCVPTHRMSANRKPIWVLRFGGVPFREQSNRRDRAANMLRVRI